MELVVVVLGVVVVLVVVVVVLVVVLKVVVVVTGVEVRGAVLCAVLDVDDLRQLHVFGHKSDVNLEEQSSIFKE